MPTLEDTLSDKTLAALRRAVQAPILVASDPEYDTARRVWNGMIDRRPSAIVRATTMADVMETVRFAREHGLPASVRSGGHGVSGKAVADHVLLIDLSSMREVRIDAGRKTAIVQGGARWGDFDREAEKFKLATTGGVISSTGVAGLTLGGGIGWLMGKYGLSCDNLISAELVSAEGRHLSVSANQNQDLFWAIRGGGGNFGIVTAFEFQLHDLDRVHGGMMLYPRPVAFDLLRQYRDITQKAPDELTAYAALMVGNGSPVVGIAFCHSGASAEGAAASRLFQLSTPPAVNLTGEKKYTEIQTMLDISAPAGLHYYFKCPFLRELTDDALRAIIEHSEAMPTELSQVVLEHMHGKASRIPAKETAFGLRRVHYSINIIATWEDPADGEKCIDWIRGFASAMEQFGASDAYVNYLGDEGQSAVRASYGANYEKLARLKKEYDPDNFFHFNQNIPPAG